MNLADLKAFVDTKWDEDLVPQLVDYVRVPAKSPAFDASWDAHGHLRDIGTAVRVLDQFIRASQTKLTLAVLSIAVVSSLAE